MGLKESGLRGSLRSVSTRVPAIPDSVVHHFPMDEGSGDNINDAEGDVVGSISGADWITDPYGLSFDGVDDYVNISGIDAEGSSHTILYWIQYFDGDRIFDTQNGGRYIHRGDQSSNSDFTVFSGGDDRDPSPSVDLSSDWQHVGVVNDDDDGEYTIYIDGDESATGDYFTEEIDDSWDSILGSSSNTFGSGASEMDMRDFMVANEALTDDEIESIYNATSK